MTKHDHKFPEAEWPFEDWIDSAAFTTTRVAYENYPVLLVVHELDGDWQFLCDTTNAMEHALVICLGCAFEINKDIGAVANLPLGWQAWRRSASDPWERTPIESDIDE